MKSLLCFLALIAVTFAAAANLASNVGNKEVLSLGGNVKTWNRERTIDINGGKRNEYIKYCPDKKDKSLHCTQFVKMDGKKADPVTLASVSADGKLTITKVGSFDEGSYTSPESKGNQITLLLPRY